MYLNPPLPTAGMKYPIKAPIAAAGVKVSELPAKKDNPKGNSLSITTALQAIKLTTAINMCESHAERISFAVKFS